VELDGRIARQYDKDMEIALAQDEVAAAVVQNHFPDASKMAGARIRLGEINALIAPLSISAEGLAQLGFNPVATDKAAKLYDASRFEAIKAALSGVISRAALRAAT